MKRFLLCSTSILYLALTSAGPVVAETAAARNEEGVRATIAAWRRAWERKDIDRYMSFYDADFWAGGLDTEGWREKKTRLFRAPGALSVTVSNLRVSLAGSEATAAFVQEYSSPLMSDIGRKTLRLSYGPDGWKIASEEWTAMTARELEIARKARRPDKPEAASESEAAASEPEVAAPASEAAAPAPATAAPRPGTVASGPPTAGSPEKHAAREKAHPVAASRSGPRTAVSDEARKGIRGMVQKADIPAALAPGAALGLIIGLLAHRKTRSGWRWGIPFGLIWPLGFLVQAVFEGRKLYVPVGPALLLFWAAGMVVLASRPFLCPGCGRSLTNEQWRNRTCPRCEDRDTATPEQASEPQADSA